MTKIEFEKFLEQKGPARSETPIDGEAQKRKWLENLAKFYSAVEEYLAEFQKSGKVKLEMSKVLLTEECIGEYQADSMAIFLGPDKVTLVPIGTLLIGARGRVDMTGPAGTAKFILTGKHSNGISLSFSAAGETQPARETRPETVTPDELVWKLATPPPKVHFIELKPETFFSALTEVVNG